MLILLTILYLIQLDPNVIGKWKQINPDRIGFYETMEFKQDSLIIKEEFFSKNKYLVHGNNLKVTRPDPSGKAETVIESDFIVNRDTLILIKNNGEIKDKMFRISKKKGTNKLFGEWLGRTNGGVITYLTFNEDGSSFYKAVLQSEKFKCSISEKEILIFTNTTPRIVDYKIKNNTLKIIYRDTKEEFTYRRTNEKD